MHVFHLKDLATPTHPEIALTLQRWRRANNSGEHRHDGVEIVFVLSGSGVNFLDGRPFPIIAGVLYVVNRGAVHSFYSNNELIFYNLLFSFSLFSRREQEEFRRIPEFERVFAPALTRGAGFDKLSLPPAAAERLRELFEALNRELRTAAPGSRLGVRATLMLLIVEICRCAAAPPSPLAAAKDNHHSPLTRIIDFLNANFRRQFDRYRVIRDGLHFRPFKLLAGHFDLAAPRGTDQLTQRLILARELLHLPGIADYFNRDGFHAISCSQPDLFPDTEEPHRPQNLHRRSLRHHLAEHFQRIHQHTLFDLHFHYLHDVKTQSAPAVSRPPEPITNRIILITQR